MRGETAQVLHGSVPVEMEISKSGEWVQGGATAP